MDNRFQAGRQTDRQTYRIAKAMRLHSRKQRVYAMQTDNLNATKEKRY